MVSKQSIIKIINDAIDNSGEPSLCLCKYEVMGVLFRKERCEKLVEHHCICGMKDEVNFKRCRKFHQSIYPRNSEFNCIKITDWSGHSITHNCLLHKCYCRYTDGEYCLRNLGKLHKCVCPSIHCRSRKHKNKRCKDIRKGGCNYSGIFNKHFLCSNLDCFYSHNKKFRNIFNNNSIKYIGEIIGKSTGLSLDVSQIISEYYR